MVAASLIRIIPLIGADAVIENQAQPVMPKLGLGYSDLVKVNAEALFKAIQAVE